MTLVKYLIAKLQLNVVGVLLSVSSITEWK